MVIKRNTKKIIKTQTKRIKLINYRLKYQIIILFFIFMELGGFQRMDGYMMIDFDWGKVINEVIQFE